MHKSRSCCRSCSIRVVLIAYRTVYTMLLQQALTNLFPNIKTVYIQYSCTNDLYVSHQSGVFLPLKGREREYSSDVHKIKIVATTTLTTVAWTAVFCQVSQLRGKAIVWHARTNACSQLGRLAIRYLKHCFSPPCHTSEKDEYDDIGYLRENACF